MSSKGRLAEAVKKAFRLDDYLSYDEARRVRALPRGQQRLHVGVNGHRPLFYRASVLVPGIGRELDKMLGGPITHERIAFWQWLATIPSRHQRDAAIAYQANPARAQAYWACEPWERVLFHDRKPKGIQCLDDAHEIYRGLYLFLSALRHQPHRWVAQHTTQFAAPAFGAGRADPRSYSVYWAVAELIRDLGEVPKLRDNGYCFGKKPKP